MSLPLIAQIKNQGAVGAVTIDGQVWNQVAMRPVIPFGKWGVALDLVIYFDAEGKKFKDFMDGKLSILKNIKPNIEDFKNHLATIFTEVRLKKYIEIRSLDTCEWDCHCGGPAFYVGLLYGNLNEAFDIINKWKPSEVLNAYIDAPKKGLNTVLNNKTLLEWGKIFLNLSKKGLEKRSIKNDSGKDESIFLRNVESILTNNKTKAEVTIEKFQKDNSLEFLYEKA